MSHDSSSSADIRVIVAGSREYTDRRTIAKALSRVYRENAPRRLVVVHGAARGADSIADAVCRDNADTGKLVAEPHPARWRGEDGVYQPGAGHIRNAEMVSRGAELCLAFYSNGAKNIGTSDCVRRAWKAGIPVREYWEGL